MVGQLKIEREDNSSANGQFVYMDDVRVGDAAVDTTAPGPITGFQGVLNNGKEIMVMWTNPADSDYVKTVIRYRTDTFLISPRYGTSVHHQGDHPGLHQR